jgi:hypothetical protein
LHRNGDKFSLFLKKTMINSSIPLRQLLKPLYNIFFGLLFLAIDISHSTWTKVGNGEKSGMKFDFVNDLIGAIMITWAVRQLITVYHDYNYKKNMDMVIFMAYLMCIRAIDDFFIYPENELFALCLIPFSIFILYAEWLFIQSMQRLSSAAQLHNSAENWRKASFLFLYFIFIPSLFLYIISPFLSFLVEKIPFLPLISIVLGAFIVFFCGFILYVILAMIQEIKDCSVG